MFGGDNELGNILQEAVKIKSAQMGQKRKTYETWPFFVQHTLFHGEKDDFKAWRQLPFNEKIVLCEGIKQKGNELFAAREWSDAVDRYEEAPTLVYYCYSTDGGWRKNNRGIDDDVLVLVDDPGETPEEAEQQRKLRLSCALNIAACKLHLQKYEEVIAACDNALELDPDNVKALYRRAEARIRPSRSTAYDHDMAIKDLTKAADMEPKNQTVGKLLKELRGERKVQRSKDATTFTGMFDRGELYEGKEEELVVRDPPIKNPNADLKKIQSRIDNITDEDSLEKRTADAELLRDLYMRNGKEDEAKELNEKIQSAKKALKERDQPKFNWDNPTEDMIQDAKKYDLNLEDPIVVAELKRLEQEGLGDAPPEDMDEAPESLRTDVGNNGDLPYPEADPGLPVPWLRYFLLFAVIFVAFKILETGVVRWTVVLLRRRFVGLISAVRGSADDALPDDERGKGIFSAAYSGIRQLFGQDVEGEL